MKVLFFVLLSLSVSCISTISIGADGSYPPGFDTWGVARLYPVLKVNQGVRVVFNSAVNQTVANTTLAGYESCSGGFVLNHGDHYEFDTSKVSPGSYYFISTLANGLDCKANMKVQVLVGNPVTTCLALNSERKMKVKKNKCKRTKGCVFNFRAKRCSGWTL